jgi:hypothetical protein
MYPSELRLYDPKLRPSHPLKEESNSQLVI